MKTKLLALILFAGGSLFAHTHWSFAIGIGSPVAYPYYAPPVAYAYAPYHCARPAYVYRTRHWYPARYRYVVRTRYYYRPVRYYYRARYYRPAYYGRAYCRRY